MSAEHGAWSTEVRPCSAKVRGSSKLAHCGARARRILLHRSLRERIWRAWSVVPTQGIGIAAVLIFAFYRHSSLLLEAPSPSTCSWLFLGVTFRGLVQGHRAWKERSEGLTSTGPGHPTNTEWHLKIWSRTELPRFTPPLGRGPRRHDPLHCSISSPTKTILSPLQQACLQSRRRGS